MGSSAFNPIVLSGDVGAFINFNGIGTISIRQSFNISSVTDNGVGDFTLNFTVNFPDANYAMAGSMDGLPDADPGCVESYTDTFQVGSLGLSLGRPSGVSDAKYICAIITR
jgi:hypothetical protein